MFYLKKHYFDGIDQHGNTVIVYGAWLGFFGLKIPYTAYLLVDENGATERSCLKPLAFSANGHVAQDALQIRGQWQADSAPLQVRLMAQGDYFLNWHPHQPRSIFDVQIGTRRFHGSGYAETLETNIPPWRLPLSELRWGRFIADGHYLVWIEWRGEQPLKKLFWNGREIKDFTLSDHELRLHQESARLYFANAHILKDAPLSALATRYPFLRLLVKKRFWQTRETKYQATAQLQLADGTSFAGRALYETVLWEK